MHIIIDHADDARAIKSPIASNVVPMVITKISIVVGHLVPRIPTTTMKRNRPTPIIITGIPNSGLLPPNIPRSAVKSPTKMMTILIRTLKMRVMHPIYTYPTY